MYDRADGGSGGTGGKARGPEDEKGSGNGDHPRDEKGPEVPPAGDPESEQERTFDSDAGREESIVFPDKEEYNKQQESKKENAKESDQSTVYSAQGDAQKRATRRPEFDTMRYIGFEVNGTHYELNEHAYNSMFKSGRKDIMPADIKDALKSQPAAANPGSVKYVNPYTGTTVFVNPETNQIVGIWPAEFIE